MTITEALWQGFIEYGDDITLEQMRKHMKTKGFKNWSQPSFYNVRRCTELVREALAKMSEPTLSLVNNFVKANKGQSFSEAYYNHVRARMDKEKQEAEERRQAEAGKPKMTKVALARRILTDLGVETNTNEVIALMFKEGVTGDKGTVNTAKRELRQQQQQEGTSVGDQMAAQGTPDTTPPLPDSPVETPTVATTLPDPPEAKQTPSVDLAVYREFVASVNQFGEQAVEGFLAFAFTHGQDKLDYMLMVYRESRNDSGR